MMWTLPTCTHSVSVDVESCKCFRVTAMLVNIGCLYVCDCKHCLLLTGVLCRITVIAMRGIECMRKSCNDYVHDVQV